MSQVPVKWVSKTTRFYPAVVDQDNYIPVVPLAALREVVEGLPDKFRQYEHTLLEAHAGMTEEQLCGAAIALHWVKKRLLASLGEVGK